MVVIHYPESWVSKFASAGNESLSPLGLLIGCEGKESIWISGSVPIIIDDNVQNKAMEFLWRSDINDVAVSDWVAFQSRECTRNLLGGTNVVGLLYCFPSEVALKSAEVREGLEHSLRGCNVKLVAFLGPEGGWEFLCFHGGEWEPAGRSVAEALPAYSSVYLDRVVAIELSCFPSGGEEEKDSLLAEVEEKAGRMFDSLDIVDYLERKIDWSQSAPERHFRLQALSPQAKHYICNAVVDHSQVDKGKEGEPWLAGLDSYSSAPDYLSGEGGVSLEAWKGKRVFHAFIRAVAVSAQPGVQMETMRKFLKEDFLRSLKCRFEDALDDSESANASLGVSNPIRASWRSGVMRAPSRGVFFCASWNMPVCEYWYPMDTALNVRSRVAEFLGLRLADVRQHRIHVRHELAWTKDHFGSCWDGEGTEEETSFFGGGKKEGDMGSQSMVEWCGEHWILVVGFFLTLLSFLLPLMLEELEKVRTGRQEL